MPAQAVAARGILFNDAMAQAVAENRKTQTRRPAKCLPAERGYDDRWHDTGRGTWQHWYGFERCEFLRCPLGVVGDLLYVRECWGTSPHHDDKTAAQLRALPGFGVLEIDHRAADDRYTQGVERWRPSIHMPRWAARTWLKITAVRVERVQAITEEDALAEGVAAGEATDGGRSRVLGFIDTWDALYAAKGLGWGDNPWVWAVSFEKCEAPA